MRRVQFEQGSSEWLNWRKSLITATDAPMLLGASPYATPYQCWQRKVEEISEQQDTDAMRRGRQDEIIAREWFNREYNISMQPCCIESTVYNFLGASLDGISACGKYILEVKSNGDQYHFGLTTGLPDFHFFQMQHQMLCGDGDIEKGFYVSWNKGQAIVKEVYPDLTWMGEYLKEAKDFWRRIVFFDPPPLSNKDYKDMSDTPSWKLCADRYRKTCHEINMLEEIKENYRKELITLCGDNSCRGQGIKVLKKFSKGRIDYKEVIDKMNVNFNEDEFRKSPTSSWMIMIDQK